MRKRADVQGRERIHVDTSQGVSKNVPILTHRGFYVVTYLKKIPQTASTTLRSQDWAGACLRPQFLIGTRLGGIEGKEASLQIFADLSYL